MIPIEPTPFNGTWKGRVARERGVDYTPLAADSATNVDLYGNVIAKRGGTHRTSMVQLGDATSHRVHAMFQAKWRAGTGVDEVLAAAGAMIQTIGDPPSADHFNLADLPTGTPARQVPTYVHFEQLDNQLFIADGVNQNLRYGYESGVPKLRKMGLDAPLLPPAASVVAGGSIADAFGRSFRYTYVNSLTQAESEPSPPPSPVVGPATGANGTYRIVTVASTDPQVDRARIYASVDGGDGLWLFLTEVNDGATYDWTSGGDSMLGTLLEEFVNYPPPSPLRLLVSWPQAGLLLGVEETHPSILYYTDLVLGDLKPESWPADNLIFVDVDSGDEIVGLYPFTDSVVILKRRSIWRIRGIPPSIELQAVQSDPTRTAIGGMSQHALVQVDDEVVSPFLDGAYQISQYQGDATGGFSSQRLSKAIDDLWMELNPSTMRKAHAVYHRRRKQYRLWMAHGSLDEAQRCFVYQVDMNPDEGGGAWTVWNILKPDGMPENQTASLVIETPGGDLVYLGTLDGYILEMDKGFEDSWSGDTPGNGAAYPFEWTTVPVQFAQDGSQVRMRYLDLVAHALTTAHISLTPETDFAIAWPSVPITLTVTGEFVLDSPTEGVLDVNRLGSGKQLDPQRAVLLTRGAWHRLRFSNAERGVGFALQRWTAWWQPLGVKVVDRLVSQVIPPTVVPGTDPNADQTGFGQGGFGGGPFL